MQTVMKSMLTDFDGPKIAIVYYFPKRFTPFNDYTWYMVSEMVVSDCRKYYCSNDREANTHR